jgi:predicted enzyme related to lactoylglutathione lyase
MLKFDHLGVPVSDWIITRDWYVDVLGMKVEFEVLDHRMVSLTDEHDFSILFHQAAVPSRPSAFAFWFQVDDVHKSFEALSRKGARFNHPPQKAAWSYGAELLDPDGYRVCLWDEKSMKAHS